MDTIVVGLVCAWPDWQHQQTLIVPVGTTAAQVLARSGLASLVAAQGRALPADMGVFGRRIADPAEHVMQAGERLELYRPLAIDPKDIRRLRAERHPVGRRIHRLRRRSP